MNRARLTYTPCALPSSAPGLYRGGPPPKFTMGARVRRSTIVPAPAGACRAAYRLSAPP